VSTRNIQFTVSGKLLECGMTSEVSVAQPSCKGVFFAKDLKALTSATKQHFVQGELQELSV
jgi:hypothetical protein